MNNMIDIAYESFVNDICYDMAIEANNKFKKTSPYTPTTQEINAARSKIAEYVNYSYRSSFKSDHSDDLEKLGKQNMLKFNKATKEDHKFLNDLIVYEFDLTSEAKKLIENKYGKCNFDKFLINYNADSRKWISCRNNKSRYYLSHEEEMYYGQAAFNTSMMMQSMNHSTSVVYL